MRPGMRSGLSRLAVVLVGAAAFCSSALAQSRPVEGKLFFIPASSGYGITECFAPGATCGRVVADAWCEANGRGPSLAWGRADDITASLTAEQRNRQPIETGSLVVNCGE